MVKSGWVRSEGKTEFTVTVPANCTALVRLPDGGERVAEAIAPYGGADAYLKHYFPEEGTLKVFIRGGSTFTLDLTTGNGLFESVRKRTVLSAFNRLHYNPSRWWTIFSDIFLAGLLVIVATGLVMVRGRNGLAGRGGAELAAGILVPLLFIFLT